MLMQWEQNYSVGVTLLDYQHKKLIELINQLHQALESGKGTEVVGPVLKSLIQYTRAHFSTEEKLLGEYAYPDLDQHRELHKALVVRVLEFQKSLEGGNKMLSVSVMNFLKDWLKSHILDSDKRYSPFLKQKGVN